MIAASQLLNMEVTGLVMNPPPPESAGFCKLAGAALLAIQKPKHGLSALVPVRIAARTTTVGSSL